MAMALCILLLLLPICAAQQAGTLKTEGNPTMMVKECTKAGGCTVKEHKLVLDANWRWIHTTEGYKNCYTGNTWDTSICTDPDTCAQGCALEAVDAGQYESIYGITAVPGGVRLNFVTGSNVGSRLFLLEDDETYKLFQLKNREFAVEVDSSTVECGMNGAMYFIEMAADGGKGLGYNAAGAKYGTGYCDAQCPHDVKFIDGKANSKDWKPHPKDFSNTIGLGHYGACCAEMDIWEANNMATAYTPHPCNIDTPGQYMCEGTECGDNDSGERYDGVCDKDGCDINPFRNGNTTFYGQGPGFAVDSSRPMTVVTQFLTTDGTDDGDMSEIRRFYVQDGRAIASPSITILPKGPDSITDEMCEDIKDLFENLNDFKENGGNKAMGESLERGHVAAFSLWDDIDVHMMWLDSCYPEDKSCSDPGVHRGMCPGGEESSPRNVRSKHPRGYVTFANAAVGEIGSTQSVYPGAPMTSLPPTTATSTMTTTTSTTMIADAWTPVDGGEGRACRGASRGDNDPAYYTLAKGVTSLQECQMHCAATAGCQGIEFSRQRCEVWLRTEGIQASIPLPGFTCMRYAGPLVTTTTPMAGTWSPVDGGDGRACRGAAANDNLPSYYTVVPGLVSLDACKAKCEATPSCQGVEFKIGRCEVWMRPGGIQASIPLPGFTCLSHASPGSSTGSPSHYSRTAPTTTTAMEGTSATMTTTVAATTTSQTAPATTKPGTSCAEAWKQCGGRNHAGPTCCTEGYSCIVDNEWYSQCKPDSAALAQQPAVQKRSVRRHKFLGPSFMQSKARTRRVLSSSKLQFQGDEL